MAGLLRLLHCLLLISFLAAVGHAPARAAELVMFESQACTWCETWNAEIAPTYPKTAEARIAPLRRVDIFDDLPPDLRGLKAVIYTPTFVLMHEGAEIGRIRGYPGEDFFWPLLDELIAKLPRPENDEQLSSRRGAQTNIICDTGPQAGEHQGKRMSC